MPCTWETREAWTGVFDILGFKELLKKDSKLQFLLEDSISELIEALESEEARLGHLDSMVFSDTLIVFAPAAAPEDYGWFLLQCERLIERSLEVRLPLRGAISVGPISRAKEHPIIIGPAFVEAFEYCEDQDWIGLLLTPSATRALRASDLEPRRHDFAGDAIPLRKLPPDDVMAYTFGMEANYENHWLQFLREMRHGAPAYAKGKYDRTIEHIQKHHKWMKASPGRP